jgi:hypothetical protein
MLDWPSLMTSSNCRLVWSLLSDWCNFGGIPLAVEIPCSWVEPASGSPDGRFPHSARTQGVGHWPTRSGENRYVAVPHTFINKSRCRRMLMCLCMSENGYCLLSSYKSLPATTEGLCYNSRSMFLLVCYDSYPLCLAPNFWSCVPLHFLLCLLRIQFCRF